MPSSADMLTLIAAVPQAFGKSFVFGTIKPTLGVIGSEIAASYCYVRGGVVTCSGCFDDHPCELNRALACSIVADCSSVL